MGILDSLENNPAFRGALSQLGAAVLPVVLSEILGSVCVARFTQFMSARLADYPDALLR